MATKHIDPFEQIENDSDTFIQAVRNIIAGVIVIGGIIFMIWFWFISV